MTFDFSYPLKVQIFMQEMKWNAEPETSDVGRRRSSIIKREPGPGREDLRRRG
jgi:hypothetical protein